MFLATHDPRAHERCCELLEQSDFDLYSLDGLDADLWRATDDPVLMGSPGRPRSRSSGFVAICVCGADRVLRASRISRSSTCSRIRTPRSRCIYKITGVWGNHEGSMLLWVLILSAVRRAGRDLRRQSAAERCKANVLARAGVDRGRVLSLHPRHLEPVPAHPGTAPFEGRDLNPILQDPGLAIHPPLLYLGYVGFSISFSFAIAALIDGRIDAAWARWVRPWTLLAWMFLTLGIAMGSYWAYYTLGWGGWWFWDPVENASLMPWLAGTALLHSALVMEKRNALKIWTILLAILTFSLSLIGTFLVRSGVLTSVHAFASDPTRGVFILGILHAVHRRRPRAVRLARAAAQAGRPVRADLARGRARPQQPVPGHAPAPPCSSARSIRSRSRRSPATRSRSARRSSIRPSGRCSSPLLLAVPFGPLLAWKRGDLLGVAQRLHRRGRGCGDRDRGDLRGRGGGPVLVPFAIGLALFVIAGALTDLIERTALLKVPVADRACARRAGCRARPGARRSRISALGVTLLGIVGETQWGASGSPR